MRHDWDAAAGLVDGTRRRLYGLLRAQPHPVSREDAADALHISRSLAAFHLDKLVELGLAVARPDRTAGAARGRGRPPKVYEPTGGGVSVSVPEQRYELISGILAAAVTEDPAHADVAALRIARATGYGAGAQSVGDGSSLLDVLEGLGYRPDPETDGPIGLTNCPFHELAGQHRALVCGLNRAFLTGLLDGRANTDVEARAVVPERGCCIELVSPADH